MAQAVLIATILSMMTIRTLRSLFLAAAAAYLSIGSCLAESLLLPVKSTPYDNQMSRIRPILQASGHSTKADLSLAIVNHWIESLRSIPYGFSQVWKTPSEVEASPIADCKGKAVLLYKKMKARGASNVRLVIGRRTSTSRSTHTWVEWSTANGTYLLDPTINWTAYKMDRLGDNAYVPLYAYAGGRKYRAASTTLVAKN